MAKLTMSALQIKSASKLTITISSGSKYIFVNHYDTIIAKGFIENGKLQGIEVYSSVPSTTDIRAINEVFSVYGEIKKIKGVLKLKGNGQDKWSDISINVNLDSFSIKD